MKAKPNTSFTWPLAILAGFFMVCLWGLVDVYGPWRGDLKHFDPEVSAKLETNSWRAYYEKRYWALFLSTFQMFRDQQGMPPVRSLMSAYESAEAAFLFKQGRRRSDYAKALPYLKSYFANICRTGGYERNIQSLANRELDWWIIHRERGRHGETALVRAIADVSAELYSQPWETMVPYARLKAQAMLERTERDQARGMSDADWEEIEGLLKSSYQALFQSLNKNGN